MNWMGRVLGIGEGPPGIYAEMDRLALFIGMPLAVLGGVILWLIGY